LGTSFGLRVILKENTAHNIGCCATRGVASKTQTCFYAGAAVNCFENKVNQFTAARTPYQTRAAQSRPRCMRLNLNKTTKHYGI
jgi:hypothetical protein